MTDHTNEMFGEAVGRERTLTKTQKVATLLLAMGAEPAGRILKQLDAHEVREVTRAAAQLGPVRVATLETVVEEFTQDFTTGANLVGDIARTEALLADAIPSDQVNTILSDALGVEKSDVWQQIGEVAEITLSNFLKNEHPRTTSYILSRLDAAVVGRIMPAFPRELRNEILCQLIMPPAPSDSARKLLEATLRKDLLKAGGKTTTSDTRAKVAQIINSMEPADAEDAMRKLSETRPKDARILKTMMFSFADLAGLSLRARAILFDKVSTEVIVLALRGMESDFCNEVLSSMASRSRRLVEGELSNGASPPAREIIKARKQITDLVLAMAQRNEIEIATSEPAADEESDD